MYIYNFQPVENMSKTSPEPREFRTETRETTRDVYAESRNSFEKIRANIDKTMPQYMQSITNLQQEFVAVWANIVSTIISNQQECAQKMGINSSAPEMTTKGILECTDGIVKTLDVQNKVAVATIDATRQTTKAINDSISSFAELNHNIINSFISTWPKRN